MVQVMSRPPQGNPPQWTKATLLHFVSINATPEQVRDLFTRFGVDPASLKSNPATENVRAVLHKHIEAIPGDGNTVITIPPDPKAPKAKDSSVWDVLTQSRTVIIASVALGLALAALIIAIVAYANAGPSKEEVRNQARIEMNRELGLQKDAKTGAVTAVPNGWFDKNTRAEVCENVLRANANLRTELRLPPIDVDKGLAACDRIRNTGS